MVSGWDNLLIVSELRTTHE